MRRKVHWWSINCVFFVIFYLHWQFLDNFILSFKTWNLSFNFQRITWRGQVLKYHIIIQTIPSKSFPKIFNLNFPYVSQRREREKLDSIFQVHLNWFVFISLMYSWSLNFRDTLVNGVWSYVIVIAGWLQIITFISFLGFDL